jgi:hypothetical protein
MDTPKFIQKLWNGSGGKPRPVRIERLRTVHKAAVANLKELEERRARAYLDDIGEKEILAIETEIERLEQEEAAERRRADDAEIALYADASEDVVSKLEALEHSAIRQRKIWDMHSRTLVRYRVPPLGVALEVGAGFGLERARIMRRAIAAMREQRSGVLPPPTPPRAPKPQPPVTSQALPGQQGLSDSQHGVRPSFDGPVRPARERPIDNLSPLQPDECRIRVLRAGWSPRDDLPQAHFGQILVVPASVGARAEGAVQVLEHYQPPAPNVAAPDEARP